MAHHIQAVGRAAWWTTLLLGLAGPATAEFSHKIHLAKKLDCAVCHSAAATSTQAADNLLPKPEVCINCHSGAPGQPARLKSAPQVKSPRSPAISKFNHQFHLKMPNIAGFIARAIDTKAYLSDPGDARKFLNTKNQCAACHRGLELSDAVTAAAYPRMADCLVCHTQVDPPFSCTKCHTNESHLKPASHTPDWIDVHSAGKIQDRSSCAVCHGRRFTCLGCH